MIQNKPTIYARNQHSISRKDIAKNALKVLDSLHKAGYRSLLVGGCLRDLLCGVPPKDFDVVTDAKPEQVKRVFRNCRLIGQRFRLAHVYFGRDIVEVATFRADEKGETDSEGRVLNHNTFGSLETDVKRRDFTLNALYYDIADSSIIDYTGAMHDIKLDVIRIIGNPCERYKEDPVRILRAVRFAAKLDMIIDQQTEKAINKKKHLLTNVPSSRLFDEIIKLFLSGHALSSYKKLCAYNLLGELFPLNNKLSNQANDDDYVKNKKLIKQALRNTDYRLVNNKPVTIAFLYAVFLWANYQEYLLQKIKDGEHWYRAMHQAIESVFIECSQRINIPMRHRTMVRDIWVMQSRLTAKKKLNKRRIESIIKHRHFRAGFDFLELRFLSGADELSSCYNLWSKIQDDGKLAGLVNNGHDSHIKK